MKTNRHEYKMYGYSVPVRGQTVRHAAYMDAKARKTAPMRTGSATWPYALACLLLACSASVLAVSV